MGGRPRIRKRTLLWGICKQCRKPAEMRAGAKFCSKSCSVTYQHANGLIRQVSGPEHYAWKGDLVKYKSIHQRIKRERGRAVECVNRVHQGCTSLKYEWAHIHGSDPKDVGNYQQMCKSCHITYDNQRGSGNASAKLTAEQAAEIRARYAAGGVSQQALADAFGVTQTTVSGIVRNRTYLTS